MPPEILVFDLGRVLLDFSHERMLQQMAAVAGVTESELRAALMPSGEPSRDDPQWRLESGLVSENDYYANLCERLGVAPDREALNHAASDIFTPIDASMRLVERLKSAGYRLGLLSNTNAVHWRFFTDGRYPALNSAFDVALGSFHLRAMKPDAEIYHAAAERFGVAAEQIFFTDDKSENVAGARACGWDAVVFTDAAKLQHELAARGVTC